MAAAVGGGWNSTELPRSEWTLPVPTAVLAELLDWARVAGRGERPAPAGLGRARDFAEQVRHRLEGHPGFCLVTGFDPDPDDHVTEFALLCFTGLLGEPVSQNVSGQFLTRVEDRGATLDDPTRRGHESSAELPFHADRADLVALLCVRPAEQGGLSRVASSREVHDLLVEECPDLLSTLYRPFPQDRRGEEAPGESPWCTMPVFHNEGDGLVTRYVRRFIEGSQRHEDAPRLTAEQRAAMDALDRLLQRPGLAQEMAFAPGDLQILNNFDVLHARTAFTPSAGQAGRLLLRVWLAWDRSPGLPPSFEGLYGATGPGTYRGGVRPPDAPKPTGRRVPRDLPTTADEWWSRLHIEDERRVRQ